MLTPLIQCDDALGFGLSNAHAFLEPSTAQFEMPLEDMAGDVIYAGEGSDYVAGCFGNDVIFGENGNDALIGFGGNDEFADGIVRVRQSVRVAANDAEWRVAA